LKETIVLSKPGQVVDFRFLLVEDVYVVWIAGINRYIQLKVPAFHVFKQWAEGVQQKEIISSCSLLYALPQDESTRFVNEIIDQTELLFESDTLKTGFQSVVTEPDQPVEYFSEHLYKIGGYLFKFIYRNEYLKNLFHPLFRHLEIEPLLSTSTVFELFNNGNQDAFRVNEASLRSFRVEEIDNFQGAVFMEILNVIHSMSLADWMGVIHASAVTDGKGAVIFTAPSGSGKSTIALLMMKKGFSLLSDDFVPVALNKSEIYHFPAGISVKNSSKQVLQEYIPELNIRKQSTSGENELFLSPPGQDELLANVPARAIVFVNYDPDTEYDLKRESNVEAMNQFIEQAWIAGTAETAERFLDWYFNLPVYSLRYCNNARAVEGISGLFK
jgi:hypothetical protein